MTALWAVLAIASALIVYGLGYSAGDRTRHRISRRVIAGERAYSAALRAEIEVCCDAVDKVLAEVGNVDADFRLWRGEMR